MIVRRTKTYIAKGPLLSHNLFTGGEIGQRMIRPAINLSELKERLYDKAKSD